ncbi:MAG: kelch repeat-containing protein [Verrucomicrobiota bacterium]
MRHFVFLFVCVAASVTAYAQSPAPMVWRQRTDVGSPGQYLGAAMAFDAQQGVTVMFGGEKSVLGSPALVSNDLWQYDGNTWQQVTVSGPLPVPRSGHALVYDPVDRRVLLFGGDAGGGMFLNDLWAFAFSGPAAGAWVHLTDLPSEGRWGMAMGFDGGRSVFVVVGGIKQGTEVQFPAGGSTYGGVKPATRETWLWDRNTWSAGPLSALYNNGPAQDHPDYQIMAGPLNGTLGYLPHVDRMELLAERFFPTVQIPVANVFYGAGGVSVFNGPSWSFNTGGNVSSAGGVSSLWLTSSFSRIQSAYDPARRRLVVVSAGRDASHEDTGAGWADDLAGTRGTFGLLPLDRPRPCVAHDVLRGRTVFFGGKASLTEPGDTWELIENPAAPFVITTDLSTTLLERCQGESLSLTGAATGVGPLQVRWFRDSTLVSDSVGFNLVLNGLTAEQSGAYTFEVTDPSGRKRVSQTTPVIVHAAPVVTRPQERRVIPGESFSLQVSVTSTLPVTYQWYRDATLIPGAHSSVYTKAAATVEDAGNYVVFVTSRCTTVSSDGGRVYVGPIVNQQPHAPSGVEVMTTPISLTVTGTGAGAQVGTYTTGGNTTAYPNRHAPDSPTDPLPMTFTWRHEGVPLVPGPKYTFNNTAISSQLVINAPDHEDEGAYDCLVADASGPAYAKTSAKTILVLHPLAPPSLTLLRAQGPDPRSRAGMVYDSRRGRTVMFGGEVYGVNPRTTFTTPVRYMSNDTWEWDGKVWVKRNPVNRPPAMGDFTLCYDSARGRTVLFGGYVYQAPTYHFGTQVLSNQVWEWDGVDWMEMPSATPSPTPRAQARMCYDSVRQEVLMLGGTAYNPTPPGTADYYGLVHALWAWDGTRWTSRPEFPLGPNRSFPVQTFSGGDLVFDEHRGVAVAFAPFNDPAYPVWEWNGTAWIRNEVPLSLRVSDSRAGGTGFYDPVRRMVCLPIVSNNLLPNISPSTATLVYWDGLSFKRADTTTIDDVTGATINLYESGPLLGQGDLSCFDTRRRCQVWLDMENFFYNGPATTREMHFSAKVKPVHQPVEVVFTPNQTLQLRVISAGKRPLTHQWLKDGLPIFDNGHWTGADKGTLTISNAMAADAGVYSLRVNNVFNQVTSADIRVRLQPIGISAVVQGSGLVLSWPGAGILEFSGSPAGPWVPIFGATAPYSVAMDEERRFYRVRYP